MKNKNKLSWIFYSFAICLVLLLGLKFGGDFSKIFSGWRNNQYYSWMEIVELSPFILIISFVISFLFFRDSSKKDKK